MKKRVGTLLLFLAVLAGGGNLFAAGEDELFIEGDRLAKVLRAGRTVVSANQDLINDPTKGDKGLSPEVFLAQLTAAYLEKNGEPPLVPDLSERQRNLTQAQLDAMAEVIGEQQVLINTPEMGFKGFIPALFGRLVNERFSEKVGDLAKVKVTAPADLVRNRTALPDPWEAAVIADKFQSAGWAKGEPWAEEVTEGNRTVFRMLIPEYYSSSCLSCHGEPKGEMDVTGFPKEGGHEGDLGGAISIILRP
ncbi:MAG: histidine kinase [Cereibacter sphaeroides]|uniref:Histidine kinase n=1 Tax=Cereibacter sphaeroides TaxID=1063 RepID=A0A2W5U1G8_CERSP|nr:MAG: histidine kinase [Cereibacter sphaeroides]